jgi:hypothetical protein
MKRRLGRLSSIRKDNVKQDLKDSVAVWIGRMYLALGSNEGDHCNEASWYTEVENIWTRAATVKLTLHSAGSLT